MFSQIGSGAMPVDLLSSYGLQVRHAGNGRPGGHLLRLETRLRGLSRPAIGRITVDALWLDLRCLEQGDEAVCRTVPYFLSVPWPTICLSWRH